MKKKYMLQTMQTGEENSALLQPQSTSGLTNFPTISSFLDLLTPKKPEIHPWHPAHIQWTARWWELCDPAWRHPCWDLVPRPDTGGQRPLGNEQKHHNTWDSSYWQESPKWALMPSNSESFLLWLSLCLFFWLLLKIWKARGNTSLLPWVEKTGALKSDCLVWIWNS